MDWASIGGAIGGSIISGLFGQSSAKSQFDRQLELMERQHQLQVDDYQHRYQWSTQDMRKAGLNPILAATSGIGGNIAGVSAGNAAQAPTPDFATSINSAFARDVAKKGLDIEQMNANTAKFKAETERMGVENEAKNLESQVEYRTVQMNLAKEMQAFEIDLKKQQYDRDTQIAFQRLDAEIEHWQRQDLNGAAMAGAAFASAAAQQALAATAEANGISERQLKEAEAIMTGQRTLTEEQRTIQEAWRNSPEYRASQTAVGFVSSVLSIASLAKGAGSAIESGIHD